MTTEREKRALADWHNAETCIENMQIAYDDATEADPFDDGNPIPVDTVVDAGDLGVLIGLAQWAVDHRLAFAAEPDGMVLVPVTLTDEMVSAWMPSPPERNQPMSDDDQLDPHLPDSIHAAKRCGIQRSEWLTGWFIPWSPRNDNENAEGPWSDWVALAHTILKADADARAALAKGNAS